MKTITHFFARRFALTLLVMLTASTAWAQGIDYIDENGETQPCQSYTLITSSTNQLDKGWYVVDGNVTINSTIVIKADDTSGGSAHFILKDGATLTVNPGDGNPAFSTSSNRSICFYAQSNTGNSMGQLFANGNGLDSSQGVIIYGGNINTNGIYSTVFSIYDGQLHVTGNIEAVTNININGGQVSVTGSVKPNVHNIDNTKRTNLSLRNNSTDFITAGSYKGTVTIAEGQTLTDGTNCYSGTLTAAQRSAIAGKTLKRLFPECTATVPDQVMKAYNYTYNYMMEFAYVFNKFECANEPSSYGYIEIGEIVSVGEDTLVLGRDYRFGDVYFSDMTGLNEPYQVNDECLVEIIGIGEYFGTIYVPFTIISENVSPTTWGDLTWSLTDGALSIALTNPDGGNKPMKAASNNSGYPWYPYGSYVTSITIGDGITSIADHAFAGTSNVNTYGGVTSVTLPSSLKRIGEYAFAYCAGATFNLDDILADTQVTIDSIGTSAFNQVGKLVGTLSATADNTGLINILVQTTTADVTLDGRTLYKDGTWNTLCLPFDIDDINATNWWDYEPSWPSLYGATLMELDVNGYYNNEGNLWPGNTSYDGYHQTGLAADGTLYLNYKQTTEIIAGKPYLIKWASGDNIVTPTFSGVNIASTVANSIDFTGGSFKGTYNSVTSSTEEINLVEDHDNATNAFHAFFSIKKTGNALSGITPNNKLQNTNTMVYTTTWTANPTGSATAWNTQNNGGWCFIASPIEANVAIAEVDNLIAEPASNYDLYRLNPKTSIWENYKAVDEYDRPIHADFTAMVNGKGYLYANAGAVTLRFTGTPYNNSSKEVDLEQGWNLVGNPFATNATLDRSYYVMNGNGTGIEAVALDGSNAIVPCTGVIVQATGENETVTFTKVTRGNAASDQGNIDIALTQNGSMLDKAIVSFNEGSQLGKFYFGEQNANIYIQQDGEDYAIVYCEQFNEIPVNFKAKENGEYTLTVTAPLTSQFSVLHLIDNLTGANVDLLQTPSYTFTAQKDDYASRFKLVFDEQQGGAESDKEFAFISNGEIIVNGEGTVQVIDALGRILFSQENSTLNPHLSTLTYKPGVYVLRLINGEDVKTQKILIK